MKKEIKSYMHVALVLDASGSMGSLRTTTVESLKKFFAGLKSDEDKTLLDVWQFDDEVKHPRRSTTPSAPASTNWGASSPPSPRPSVPTA